LEVRVLPVATVVVYEFLRPKRQRLDWVEQSAARLTQERERVTAILQNNPRI